MEIVDVASHPKGVPMFYAVETVERAGVRYTDKVTPFFTTRAEAKRALDALPNIDNPRQLGKFTSE